MEIIPGLIMNHYYLLSQAFWCITCARLYVLNNSEDLPVCRIE